MIDHDAYVKDFVKKCKKKKSKGMWLLPKGIKSWGCKKAAERSYKQLVKNAPKENAAAKKLKLRW